MILIETKDVPFFERAHEIYNYKFEHHSLFTLMCVCSKESGDFEAAMLRDRRVERVLFPRDQFKDPEA